MSEPEEEGFKTISSQAVRQIIWLELRCVLKWLFTFGSTNYMITVDDQVALVLQGFGTEWTVYEFDSYEKEG